MDDISIVRELHQQNRDAYSWMYEKYYKVLLAHADFLLKDETEAEEAVQDVFCKLLQLKNWDHIQNLRPYLYKVLHNYCLARISDTKKAAEKKYLFLRQMEPDITDIPDLQEARQTEMKLGQLLSHLSPQRLRAFHLVYQEGLSYEEAAASLGISKNSIKTHIKLGLRVLRNYGFVLACGFMMSFF